MGIPVNSNNFSNVEHFDFCPAVEEKVIFTFCLVVFFLCAPVYVLILSIGFKKWRKRPSANFSHSDVFTFNIILTESCSYVGSIIVLVGLHTDLSPIVLYAGIGMMLINGVGQMFFHSFTCVDRYLAVVHPVTYLSLKNQSKITARNLTVAFVWLVCVGITVAMFFFDWSQSVIGIVNSSLTLAVVLFCTIAVLCVLIRPKPGEIVRVKKNSDKSKRQAFYTIALILAALVLRFLPEMLVYIMELFEVFEADSCLVPVISLWFALPSSLVLPLLFLHRARALKVCRRQCMV